MDNKRWYDSAKVIWGLFALTLFMLVAYSGVLWSSIEKAGSDNASQDLKIQRVEVLMDGMDKRQERMDGKLDRILERLPK